MSKEHECHVDPVEKPLDKEALKTATAAYLAVSGMGCERCAMRVRNGLLGLDGVLLSDVFLQQSVAVAAYNPETVTVEDLLNAVSGAGNDGKHHYSAQLLKEVPALEAVILDE